MTGCLIPSLCTVKVGGHAVTKAFLRIPFSLSSALRCLFKTSSIRLKASAAEPPCCLAFMCEKSTDNSAGDLIWAIYGTQTTPCCIPELCLTMQLGAISSWPRPSTKSPENKKVFLEIWFHVLEIHASKMSLCSARLGLAHINFINSSNHQRFSECCT